MKKRYICLLLLTPLMCLASCGENFSSTSQAHTHTVVIDKGVAPTCQKEGLSEGSHCSVCGEVIVAQHPIDKLDHKIVIDSAIEPTCHSKGLTEGSHCKVCGEVIVVQEEVECCEHNLVYQKGYDATKSEVGLTDGCYCKTCGTIIQKQEIIPVLTKKTVQFTVDSTKGRLVGTTTQCNYQRSFTTTVSAYGSLGYRFSHWSNGETNRSISVQIEDDVTIEAIFVEDKSIPLITINTENGHAVDSKEIWYQCTVSTSLCEDKYITNNLTGKIKGRGNSTWGMPKKPYKFKLEEKSNLLGLGKAKNWVLLANYCDPSGVRSSLAYNTGKQIDCMSEFTTDTTLVEVILNGKYQGVYNLIEQIEINKNRVDITKDSSEADTGYIVEMDVRAKDEGVSGKDYFVIDGKYYAIKDPDTDDELTSEQFTFIKNYMTQCYNALFSGNYSTITSLIDVDTFAANYIIQELFHNVDVADISFYFYKDAGGLLCNGPIWDFDISVGNCNYNAHETDPEYLYAKNQNVWYRQLLSFSNFKNLVKEKLSQNVNKLESTIDEVLNDALNHEDAFSRNFDTWKTIGKYVWPNTDEIVGIKTWKGQLEYVKNWLSRSLAFMKKSYL